MAVRIIGLVNERDAKGDQVLVQKGDEFFVVSSVVAPFTGFETLVFPADPEGNITDWMEVAGGRGMTREEAIVELDDYYPDTFDGTAIEIRGEIEAG